jgi:drug/metabolite transporter (DMT)-like permease
MVSLLGATGGAAFVALTPAMTALMGIPVLGEWPSAVDWVAIATISIGVYAVSGGPMPMLRPALSASGNAPLARSPRTSE